MYELFLETRAATGCRNYANDNELDEDTILRAAYAHTISSKYGGLIRDSDWFVRQCLEGDRHKNLSLLDAFSWQDNSDYPWAYVYEEERP